MTHNIKAQRVILLPTAAEDEAIAAGIAADPDNPEWTEQGFSSPQSASEALPPEVYAALRRPRGRPKAQDLKVFTGIRLDADLLEAFKATGKGWQTRVNAALRQYISEHPIHRQKGAE